MCNVWVPAGILVPILPYSYSTGDIYVLVPTPGISSINSSPKYAIIVNKWGVSISLVLRIIILVSDTQGCESETIVFWIIYTPGFLGIGSYVAFNTSNKSKSPCILSLLHWLRKYARSFDSHNSCICTWSGWKCSWIWYPEWWNRPWTDWIQIRPFTIKIESVREAAKSCFLVARPLRGGRGKGLATKKKNTFFEAQEKKIPPKCGH